MQRNQATLLAALGIAILGGVPGCARPKPNPVPPPPPPLEIPVVPPRVLAPVTVEPEEPAATESEPAVPAPRRPTRPRPRQDGARPEEPSQAEPAGKTDAPPESPAAEKPAVPDATSVLQTPQTADDGEAARRIRDVLARARRDLAKINVRALGSDARTQYETARRFMDQAEDALTVKNYMFAQYLADKAEALARGLQGR